MRQESNQVLLIVDRGLLYFAKFVGALVLLIFAIATAYFGFDMNKAREGVEQMRKEVQESQRAVEETKQSVLPIKNEAQQQLTEAQTTQSEIHKMLAQSQQESGEIHTRYLELKIAPGDVSASIEVVARTFKVPEIASLYHFPSGLDGGGQTIALIELGGGYRDTDLDAYFASLHLRRSKVIPVSVDHGSNHPTGDPNGPDGQVMLDIEVTGAVAPAANIVVYFAPNTNTGFLDAVTAAIHDSRNKPSVISITWGSPESSWTQQSMTAFDEVFKAAAALEITVCVAAGDNGSDDGVGDGANHVDFPASSPWVLSVGGTTLVSAARQSRPKRHGTVAPREARRAAV